MQWILNAILRNKNFILFLLLLILGLFFSGTQSGYHQSKISQASLAVSGTIFSPFNQMRGYFGLNDLNIELIQENNHLKKQLIEQNKILKETQLENKPSPLDAFSSVPAHVIRNSFTKAKNIILIDKGSTDSIHPDMGVVGPKGIIGIVNQTSKNFASVLSILNQDLKINARFKSSNVFGSLSWRGNSPNKMLLSDISVINPVQIGDTIVTGGMSSYFPEGILLGFVTDFEQTEKGGYYEIEVELVNNMTDLSHVYAISNKNKTEIEALINPEK